MHKIIKWFNWCK